MSDFTAMYIPFSPNGYNPTKSGFESEDAAWDFVFSRMCTACKQEREKGLALAGEQDEEGCEYSTYPACSAEWDVLPTDEYRKLLSGVE